MNRQHSLTQWLLTRTIAMALLVGFLQAEVRAATSSSLSRWLSADAIPAMEQLLRDHPRYRGQRLQVIGSSGDALSEAVAKVIRDNLATMETVSLVAPQSVAPFPSGTPVSIDALDCRAQAEFDYQLQVTAQHISGGGDRVQLQMIEAKNSDSQLPTWAWQGRFSSAERAYLKKTAQHNPQRGSLAAPWPESAIEDAALALSRELACALRPQLLTRINLAWPQQQQLPAVFADTANASRHLLGAYRELGFSEGVADYNIEIRLEPFMQDTWQLWLVGTPRQQQFAPVQAVTYFKVDDIRWPAPVAQPVAVAIKPPLRPRPLPPKNLGEPLDYLQVELLDSTQTDRKGSRADLQVTVRIDNRGNWPIEYAFSLSGGHFDYCIARSGYYRHDRYGKLVGSIGAGESVVRRMVIENAKHRPTPFFGKRACAGFRDLDGFEAFASQGYKVTDFVRWQL